MEASKAYIICNHAGQRAGHTAILGFSFAASRTVGMAAKQPMCTVSCWQHRAWESLDLQGFLRTPQLAEFGRFDPNFHVSHVDCISQQI
jgi:hypothetical protein